MATEISNRHIRRWVAMSEGKKMKLSVGARIWLPCEVKPGPFSDEKLIKVPSAHGEVLGFVPTSYLKQASGILFPCKLLCRCKSLLLCEKS